MPKLRFDSDERYPDWTWSEPSTSDDADWYTREVSDETLARWEAAVAAYDAMQEEIEEILELGRRRLIDRWRHWLRTTYRPPEGSKERDAFEEWRATGEFG